MLTMSWSYWAREEKSTEICAHGQLRAPVPGMGSDPPTCRFGRGRRFYGCGEPSPMDGLMLVRWVDEHYPGIQVLVTSGKGDAALSSGLIPDHAFFSKPYALEEVVGRIYSLLS
jgi:hypothetical protein